ncbi:ATP-binding cassette domain-containing protein [Archaeoglobus veneficus]|uniref:ATP-binding cassette domain-containing protein n=1 Tax=Archaeoglobus veneficus TaxID=58290 RepID=UPI000A0718E7|nr:ATP-binding cassette domain-containing protein [Archaeoglobus veneficus]
MLSTGWKGFELLKVSENRVEELSKGMQQKVQIIAALIHNPDVLILDDHFPGLML